MSGVSGSRRSGIALAVAAPEFCTDADATRAIAIVGKDHQGHGYVLADASGKHQPVEWAKTAVAAYRAHHADRIVAERNNGGAMVEATIRMVDTNVPVTTVWASRGRAARAEPVSALYEQGRVHHIGTFPKLEDQMCAFTTDFDRARAGYSPDRLDALVWGLTELLVEPMPQRGNFEYTRQCAEAIRGPNPSPPQPEYGGRSAISVSRSAIYILFDRILPDRRQCHVERRTDAHQGCRMRLRATYRELFGRSPRENVIVAGDAKAFTRSSDSG